MSVLTGKTAIVTGSSRGIGKAIAERLARDGAKIIVNYATSAGEAEDVVAGIRKTGGQAIVVQADIAKLGDIPRLFDEAEAKFGTVDILVNNAGVDLIMPLQDMTEAQYDRIFAVCKGNFFALKEAAARIADNGRIITISTGATRDPAPDIAAYAGSKAAMEQFARALAKSQAKRGVTVNVVLPGFTDTVMLNSHGPGVIEFGKSLSPFGRIGRPEEVADAVAFLAGPDSRWITGEIIAATGGI